MGRRAARRDAVDAQGRGLSARRGVVAALLLLGALLAGCGGGAEPEREVVDPALQRLDRAVVAVNTARAGVLDAQDDLVAGATALDDVDEAAASGERAATRTARERAAAPVKAATAALKALPQRLTAYGAALDELAAATDGATGLDRSQRGLLGAVGTTGTAEAAAADALRRTGNGAWAGYTRLDRLSRTWLERSTAGWYRDKQEAAAAYAVLVEDLRTPLEKARAALRRADVAGRAAATRVSTALREADAALAPLR